MLNYQRLNFLNAKDFKNILTLAIQGVKGNTPSSSPRLARPAMPGWRTMPGPRGKAHLRDQWVGMDWFFGGGTISTMPTWSTQKTQHDPGGEL